MCDFAKTFSFERCCFQQRLLKILYNLRGSGKATHSSNSSPWGLFPPTNFHFLHWCGIWSETQITFPLVSMPSLLLAWVCDWADKRIMVSFSQALQQQRFLTELITGIPWNLLNFKLLLASVTGENGDSNSICLYSEFHLTGSVNICLIHSPIKYLLCLHCIWSTKYQWFRYELSIIILIWMLSFKRGLHTETGNFNRLWLMAWQCRSRARPQSKGSILQGWEHRGWAARAEAWRTSK